MPAAPRAFLKLQDVVLAAPLPAVLSVLMTSGIAFLGWRLATRLRRGPASVLDAAAGFVLVAAALAVFTHGLALAQLARIAVLRPLGWILAGTGAFALVRQRAALLGALRLELTALRAAPAWERVLAGIVAAAALGLGAAALGPVTDADSIRYHLAVPLDWLRQGGVTTRLDWFPARLVGVAEGLNLLGLAAGTDGFGAALQLGGLVVAAVAVGALAPTARDRRVAWLLVVGCPVAAFLVPNQKPQLLPAAATTAALVLAVQRFETFDAADAWLVFGCAAFAVASKLSFLITGGLALAVGLLAARKSGRLATALAIAGATVSVAWLPVLARNFLAYGDPLSPFLERFHAYPDAAVLDFATYLRDAGGERTAANLLRLPLTLLGSLDPGRLTTSLGLGALAFVGALGTRGPRRLLLWAALAATLAGLAMGQLAPRFFLESFLWAGAAFAAADWDRAKKLLVGGLAAQGALSAAVALYGAATLFPGALTPRARDAVMTRMAIGYPEGQWLDGLVPRAAVLIESPGRFVLFAPRPFVIADPALGALPPVIGDDRLRELLQQSGAKILVDEGAAADGPFARLERGCGYQLAPPRRFPVATRNPLNRAAYGAEAFGLHGCAAPSAASMPKLP